MKGHLVMYLIMGAVGVALLTRPAAAAGEMVAAGSVGGNLLGILTGQYAGEGGKVGSISMPSAGGGTGVGATTLRFG